MRVSERGIPADKARRGEDRAAVPKSNKKFSPIYYNIPAMYSRVSGVFHAKMCVIVT